MPRKQKPSGAIDRAAFAETEREPVTRGDVEAALRQVVAHPAKPESKSENREPSREELNRRFKMSRR